MSILVELQDVKSSLNVTLEKLTGLEITNTYYTEDYFEGKSPETHEEFFEFGRSFYEMRLGNEQSNDLLLLYINRLKNDIAMLEQTIKALKKEKAE
ncbi:DUF1474 family protein [Macrococcoides bohemicum]|uniref:TscT toxin domain-containing protein n=1 Tax=Macrococcoides bohemicum TaxID=1903056 RepID=A0A328A7I9_9STAP|nr:DUF1474 family protein [Macrococcus bohemicus]RAK50449.1 hypothetical protein BHX94_02995 [Macrococcus bohemicus]